MRALALPVARAMYQTPEKRECRHGGSCLNCFHCIHLLSFYLRGREAHRARTRSSSCRFTHQLPAKANAGPGQSQEAGNWNWKWKVHSIPGSLVWDVGIPDSHHPWFYFYDKISTPGGTQFDNLCHMFLSYAHVSLYPLCV